MKPLRLGILGSTRGTDMLALIAAIEAEKLPATIAVVISNQQDAIILKRAREHGLKAEFINPLGFPRHVYDQQISQELCSHHVDLVVLIGYMRILSNGFVTKWHDKIINVHPSLLPDFAGGMDYSVHDAVLQSGAKETGCTVHYVTDDLDSGPIIIQKKCPVLPDDSAGSLKARVQELEGEALIEAIQGIYNNLHAT